jgi:hypothetical protein
MKFDEVNIVVEDVFTKDQIDSIYTAIETPHQELFMGLYGQDIKDFHMSKSVKDRILEICQELSGEPVLELVAYQFAKYTNNDVKLPNLTPHYDDFENARFTFDVQLRSNTDWSLFVEGKEFLLKDNQALTFSGTHQIHWREDKLFKDGEFVDMLFCHLNIPNDTRSLEENRELMLEKKKMFTEQYNERYGK